MNGKVNGIGKYIWSDGSFWMGNITNGKLDGVGLTTLPNGNQEVIEYVNDKLGSAHPGDGTDAHYWCAQQGYVFQTIDYAHCRTIFSSNQKLEKIGSESLERQAKILSDIQKNLNRTNSPNAQLEEISRQQKILMEQQQEILRKQGNSKPEIGYKPIGKDSELLKPQLFDIKTGKPIPN